MWTTITNVELQRLFILPILEHSKSGRANVLTYAIPIHRFVQGVIGLNIFRKIVPLTNIQNTCQ